MKKLTGLMFLFVLMGCATAPTTMTTDNNYVANFDYTPDKQAVPLSSGVTFTVAGPTLTNAGNLAWATFPQFNNLPDAVRQDLTDILTAKGFGVRGPYDSYDLIPFQDKKAIDLYITTTWQPTLALKDISEKLENYWAWQSPTLQTGTAEVSGTLKLEIREIVTRELMWSKNIPFKQFEFPFTVRIPWGNGYTPGKISDFMPIMEGMAKGLEQQYRELLGTAYNLIDPEEMKILKNQAQELKKQKGY